MLVNQLQIYYATPGEDNINYQLVKTMNHKYCMHACANRPLLGACMLATVLDSRRRSAGQSNSTIRPCCTASNSYLLSRGRSGSLPSESWVFEGRRRTSCGQLIGHLTAFYWTQNR